MLEVLYRSNALIDEQLKMKYWNILNIFFFHYYYYWGVGAFFVRCMVLVIRFFFCFFGVKCSTSSKEKENVFSCTYVQHLLISAQFLHRIGGDTHFFEVCIKFYVCTTKKRKKKLENKSNLWISLVWWHKFCQLFIICKFTFQIGDFLLVLM